MKKVLLVVLSVLLVGQFALAGALAEDRPYIAMFPKNYASDFWKTVELGAKQAAEDLDVELTFEGCDNDTNIEQQIKLVENAITKKADVIAIAPLDSEGLVPILETAAAAGIKIVSFNSGLGGDVSLVHVSTDNWAAGEIAGKALGEMMGGEGKYAIIGAVETVSTNRARSEGCASAIAELYPEMELISIQYSGNDLNKTMSIMYDLLTANPDLKGIFTNNDITTIGVVTVIEEKGLQGKIQHVGFDATNQTIDFLRNGVTGALISQDAYQIGYKTVVAAKEAYEGKTFDGMVDTGVALVTAENMDDENIQKIINPLG